MIDNIDYLYIIYNIIQMFEDREYIYLGNNYEKIKKDIKKINDNIEIKENEITDYSYIIKKPMYNILTKKKQNYVLILFLESFFTIENKMDINYVLKKIYIYIYGHVYWQNIIKVYIICPDEYEDKIKKKIKKDNSGIIEVIEYTRLLYNPTQHDYFSRHEKIKNYEKRYKKYNLRLPLILSSDVAIRWYDYNINNIIKIIRKDNSICYRLVAEEDE